MNRWKFTERDFAGELVHRLGVRPRTVCGLNTQFYGQDLDDDPNLLVTCMRCVAGIGPEDPYPDRPPPSPPRLRKRRTAAR